MQRQRLVLTTLMLSSVLGACSGPLGAASELAGGKQTTAPSLTPETTALNGGATPVPTPVAGAPAATPTTAPEIPQLLTQMETAFQQGAPGLAVQPGQVGWGNVNELIACPGCNAATPYLMVGLAPSPSAGYVVPAPSVPGIIGISSPYSQVFKLGKNEAMVLIGKTPYAAKYLGFTAYRVADSASLGNPLNQNTLVTGANPNASSADPAPFDRPFVIVMTANADVTAAVKALLAPLGADAIVNVLPIPAAVTANDLATGQPATVTLTPGLSATADAYNILGRIAYSADPSARAEYYANLSSYMHSYRVSLTAADGAFTPYPVASLLPSLTTPTEASEQTELTALIAATQAAHPDALYRCDSVYAVGEGSSCIVNNRICADDTRDALYSAVLPPVALESPLGKTQYHYYFVGVNNPKMGKATYQSFNIQTDLTVPFFAGVASFNDKSFAGSATDDNLFVEEVARHCDSGDTHCLAIPEPVTCAPNDTACTRVLGVAFGRTFTVLGRNYLEPQANPLLETKPSATTLLPVTVLSDNPFLPGSCKLLPKLSTL